jgi:hypothetical protein
MAAIVRLLLRIYFFADILRNASIQEILCIIEKLIIDIFTSIRVYITAV